MKTIIYFLLFIFLVSCNNSEKFDKAKWQEQGDLKLYTHRKSMLNDLTKNHQIKGISYRQLINLIGVPENYSDNEKNILYYEIETDYGYDIDPVYTKTLEIKLTNVARASLEELKTAFEAKDMESVKTKTEALDAAWMAASEEMYAAGQQGDTGADQGQADPSGDAGTEDVQDADFEEVK